MAQQDRSLEGQRGIRLPSDEVVRLPVAESELSHRLEEMPTPVRADRRQPDPRTSLVEEAAEEIPEPDAAKLGIGWEVEEAAPAYKPTPMGWLVLIGLVLLGLGCWALIKLAKGEAHVASQTEQVRKELILDEKEDQAAMELLSRVEREVTKYLRADSIEKKASYVRHRERVLPLMRDFHRRHSLVPASFRSIEGFFPVGLGNNPFFYLAVKVDGEKKPRALFVEQRSDGSLKFDWEAEVGYQPIEPSEFIAKKSSEAMDFRVYVESDDFYGYEFSDPDRYQSLLLSFRDSDEFLFGYVERDSPVERALSAFFREDQGMQPAMLRLRFMPNTRARRSVLVEKVIAPRWVHIEGEGSREAP